MWTILTHTFSRARGTLLGWGLCLGLLGAYLMPFYDTLAEQKDTLVTLLSSYPPEMLAFFGDMSNLTAMFTPEGYLSFEFFSYLPLILGIYAVLAGSGLLAGDEENGTLDLLLAHPVSRSRMFVGRWLAFALTLVGILSLSWLGLIIGMNWSTVDISGVALARPFLSLGAELLVFGALALLLSLLLPSRRLAATTTGLSLVASFFITSLARVNEDLDSLAKFSPLNYYQGGQAITQLNLEWLGGLLAVALMCTLLAWWRFQRRDIRVGGEGGWGLPGFSWRGPASRAGQS